MFAEYQKQRKEEAPPKTIKLTYFDATGRAEAIRAVLAVGGVKFEDSRLSKEQWMLLKPNTPFGYLPVLEVDGKMVGESTACARLAAKLTGLAGKSLFEEALADSVVDVVIEIREKFIPLHFEKDEEKKKAGLEDMKTNYLPGKLEKLEAFIKDHNTGGEGFFCGGEMTWADICLVVHMEMLAPLVPDWEDSRPKLKALCDRVRSDPRFQAYLDGRPDKK